MHILGLVAATALTLASTVAHAAQPEPAAGAQTPTDAPPKSAKPRYKGTGLLATTGVLGATTLSLTIARNVILKKNCPLEGMSTQCTYDFGSDIGLAATSWSLNLATIGIASGAGVMLGRWHAWKDKTTGKQRKTTAILGAGGGLLGVGIVGIGTSAALSFVLSARCVDKELESGDALAGDRCLLKAYPAWTMTNWASFAMVSSGAAMLAYGTTHKRRSEMLASLQVAPVLGRNLAGLGVSGRF
jgi:hypothetical protein